jgi:hypothetical protein
MAEESASAVCKELLRLTEAAGAAGGEEDNGNRKHGGLGYMLVALFHREVNRYGAFSKVTAVAIDEYGGDLGNDGEGDLSGASLPISRPAGECNRARLAGSTMR